LSERNKLVQFVRSKRLKLAIFTLILLIILPSLIIGELYYSSNRLKDYEDLNGFNSHRIETNDGLQIQMWYQHDRSNAVIIVHGHADNSGLMLKRYVQFYNSIGYDAVLLDMRNHGKSEKQTPVTLGVNEREDVEAVIEWTISRNWENLVIFGTSMGAVASLLSMEKYSTYINSIILDSLFLDDQVVIENNQVKHNIPKIWRFLSQMYLEIRMGEFEFPDILMKIQELSNLQMLILHGSKDVEAPIDIIEKVENLNLNNLETVLIDGGEHSRLYRHVEFTQAITSFLAN